jgi:glycosyltransferase involved in cell wall biosynthesis
MSDETLEITASSAVERRSPVASVVITSKNRVEELVKAVSSACDQYGEIEVLVIDDGSYDGTAERIARDFPTVRVFRSEHSRGLIVQRNFAAKAARGEVIFSLDDDAIFTSERTVELTLADFADPRVGVVAMPVVDRPDPTVRQLAPADSGIFETFPFVGRAYAIRRLTFLSLGGYHGYYFQQGEESDLAIRLLERGLIVRLGRTPPIEHLPSPTRSHARIAFYRSRNDMLYAMLNVPTRRIPDLLVRRIVRNFQEAFRTAQVRATTAGFLAGAREAIARRDERDPVSLSTYSRSRLLARSPQEVAPHVSK